MSSSSKVVSAGRVGNVNYFMEQSFGSVSVEVDDGNELKSSTQINWDTANDWLAVELERTNEIDRDH